MHRSFLILLSGLAVTAVGAAHPADPAPVDGTWQKHEDTFTFSGFTTHYSCVGLETKLKLLLGLVGARPGFKVEGACADAPGAPTRIAVVRISYSTLVPATAGSADAAAEQGQGEWRAIEWGALAPRQLEAGDCELIDQFAKDILPKFATRDVQNHNTCVPNQANLSGVRLKFTVLAALPAARQARVAKTQ